MSTGLNCSFEEREPGQWYLAHEIPPNGWPDDLPEGWEDWGDPEYEEFGPFSSFASAHGYLDRHFANPGGFSISIHPDSTDETIPDFARRSP